MYAEILAEGILQRCEEAGRPPTDCEVLQVLREWPWFDVKRASKLHAGVDTAFSETIGLATTAGTISAATWKVPSLFPELFCHDGSLLMRTLVG